MVWVMAVFPSVASTGVLARLRVAEEPIGKRSVGL